MMTSLPPLSFPPISDSLLKNYATASGDLNPIHLDEAVAKSMGLPGRIAHGMLTSAWMAERVFKDFPPSQGWQIMRKHDRFRAMAFLGDILSIGGTIKSESPHSVTVELEAKKQSGEITTTCTIELRRI